MATKLTTYIMSEKFQEACARAFVRAGEEARAAGLPPAGDQAPVSLSKPRVTVVLSPSKLISKGQGVAEPNGKDTVEAERKAGE